MDRKPLIKRINGKWWVLSEEYQSFGFWLIRSAVSYVIGHARKRR